MKRKKPSPLLKKIDAEQVKALAAIGCTQKEIAGVFGTSMALIRRRFIGEWYTGREEMKARLRKLQWNAAGQGNTAMLIWLGKQYLDQVEKQEVKSDVSERRIIIYDDDPKDRPTGGGAVPSEEPQKP